MVWYGMAWHGMACYGMVRLSVEARINCIAAQEQRTISRNWNELAEGSLRSSETAKTQESSLSGCAFIIDKGILFRSPLTQPMVSAATPHEAEQNNVAAPTGAEGLGI